MVHVVGHVAVALAPRPKQEHVDAIAHADVGEVVEQRVRAVVVAARGSQPREHAGAARLVQAFDERGGVIQISALDREERLGLVDTLQERKRVTPAQAPPRLLQYVSRDAFFAGDVLHARQREHRQQRRVDVSLLGAERAGAFEIVASGIEPVAFEVHDTAHVAGRDREPELGVGDIARGVERVVGERFGFREAALRQRDLAEHAGDGDPVGGVVRIRAATNSSNVARAARAGPSTTATGPARTAHGARPRTTRTGRAADALASLGAPP